MSASILAPRTGHHMSASVMCMIGNGTWRASHPPHSHEMLARHHERRSHSWNINMHSLRACFGRCNHRTRRTVERMRIQSGRRRAGGAQADRSSARITEAEIGRGKSPATGSHTRCDPGLSVAASPCHEDPASCTNVKSFSLSRIFSVSVSRSSLSLKFLTSHLISNTKS